MVAAGGVLVGGFPSGATQTRNSFGYVANLGSSSVTPINLTTGKALAPIAVPLTPTEIVSSPNGATAYVVNFGNDETGSGQGVTPIEAADNTAGTEISAGSPPGAIVLTPNGKTAYVSSVYQPCCGDPTAPMSVVPITTATGAVGSPITVGTITQGMKLTPNGALLYVFNGAYTTDSPSTPVPTTISVINTATDLVQTTINVGVSSMVITPNNQTAFVQGSVANGPQSIIPISVSTSTAGQPLSISAQYVPQFMALSPKGQTLYVIATSDAGASPGPAKGSFLIRINTKTDAVGKAIALPVIPSGSSLLLNAKGTTAYLEGQSTGRAHANIFAVTLATGHVAKAITVAGTVEGIYVNPTGSMAYALTEPHNSAGSVNQDPPGSVIPIRLQTNKVGKAIHVGRDPNSMAFTP